MKIIITGATGMVGTEVLRQAIADKDIEHITVVIRSDLPFQHPKVTTILHRDYLNYTGLEKIFASHDACIWCLGISQTQVNREEYFAITYEFTVAAATAMLKANPDIAFLFLSGAGADPEENSRIRFARVKGKAENSLRRMPFKKLVIVRPGGIRPSAQNSQQTFYKKLELAAIRLMQWINPSAVIAADHLAEVMLFLVKNRTDRIVFENVLLRSIIPR